MTERGETRKLRLLMPGQYEIATARLQCSGTASVPLADQTLAELTEINYEVQVDGQLPSYSTIWTDADGKIVRTFSDGINLVSYRTDKATVDASLTNRNEVLALPIKGTIADPAEVTRLALSITPLKSPSKSSTPFDIVPMPGQLVRKVGDEVSQVLISRKSDTQTEGFEVSNLSPDDQDSKPNAFVDSDATLIVRYAAAAVGARKLSPQEQALELARTAGTLIADRDTPSGLVRASAVVSDGIGDSTGRAIVLAAMLRARQIPSRVAIGLRYAGGSPERMVYHMWTLAYVDDQWIQLDATSGGLAPADRIMFATSNLSGGDEYNAFIPFLNAASRIEIQILKAI